MRRLDDAEITFERVDPAGAVPRSLLRRYYDELDGRFPGGFVVDRTVQAPDDELRPPLGAFVVAARAGQPLGCGAVRMLEPATAEIKRMWLDPAARGLGLGRRLLAALERAATDLGARVVRLDTSASLAEALALYRSAGYREIPAYNDNLYAAHWFEKQL